MKSKRGFIKTIILIIIALAVLKYFFDINVLDFVRSESFQKVFGTIWDIVVAIWNDYLKASVEFVWEEIIVGTLWEGILLLKDSLKA